MVVDIKGQVTPVCSRSHITYQFQLEQSASKLCIRLAYTPKRLEDPERTREMILDSIDKYTAAGHREAVKSRWEKFLPLQNLITVSVDDPERHRGAGHRHDPVQELYLSKSGASPGLVSGRLPGGWWKVTLSLHAIVTERCDYELQIWEEGE